MKKANLTVAGIFLALSIVVIFFALQLPSSKNGVPGPGYWPILIATIMSVSSLLVGIKAFIKPEKIELFLNSSDHIRVYLAMGSLVAYLAGMYYIGFFIATCVMLYGFISWFGTYKWYTRILSSLSLTTIVYSVFRFVLKVPFRFGLLF